MGKREQALTWIEENYGKSLRPYCEQVIDNYDYSDKSFSLDLLAQEARVVMGMEKSDSDFEKKKKSERFQDVLLTIGLLVTLVSVAAGIIFLASKIDFTPKHHETTTITSTTSTGFDKYIATKNIQERILGNVKAPLTTVFPSGSLEFKFYPEKGVYGVKSYFDSQNSFGALLRTDYVAIVDVDGNVLEMTTLK